MNKLQNYINGQWVASSATDYWNVVNPASQEVMALVPAGTAADVDAAVRSSETAYAPWKRIPAGKR
ncbi:MAG: aldehyde dehydrogenase family protein, partial [Agriterribacter sp.]